MKQFFGPFEAKATGFAIVLGATPGVLLLVFQQTNFIISILITALVYGLLLVNWQSRYRLLNQRYHKLFKDTKLIRQEKTLLEKEIDVKTLIDQEISTIHTIIDEAFNGIYLTKTGSPFHVVQVNKSALTNLNLTESAILAHPFTNLVAKPDVPKVINAIEKAVREKGRVFCELVMLRKDGSMFSAEARIQYANGYLPNVFIVTQDISDRRKAETLSKKLTSAIEHTGDSVMITDQYGIIEYVNPAFENITGYDFSDVVGKKPAILRSDKHSAEFYQHLWSTILRGMNFRDVLINRKKDGSIYYEEKTITPLRDHEGKISHFVSTGKDITERMRTQKHLYYLSHHDPLTELPNRSLFIERLTHAIENCQWSHHLLAILFVDVDRFKLINDTLGHDAGDQILKTLATRLRNCVRHSDTVARLGGDEFTILLDDLKQSRDVKIIADKILESISTPIYKHGSEFFLTASIGIAIYPTDGLSASELIKNADIAMYSAKQLGKNAYQYYHAQMTAEARNQLSTEAQLRRALSRREFRVFYQPQMDIHGKHIIGLEALIRWQHPSRGLVNPIEFVPLLEETGLIIPVGEWLLNAVCHDFMRLTRRSLSVPKIAVNISQRQLNYADIIQMVEYSIENAGIAAHNLELEITENIIMQNADANINTMRLFNEKGINFSIDDFGTGYSSLSYIKKLPITTLKIDRSFIQDIENDEDDKTIVAAVVAMAKRLHLKVIAEGVENKAQLQYLADLSCDGIQGYYLSKPMPFEHLVDWIGLKKKHPQKIADHL